ncbi:MFS transporter [Micromonospora phytophila]|uniref:MFS transporter n=1 Tax=Micromonospora phytophila TaxID=709888 RepID=UPI00202DCE4E|nr:MFS transporter [Micromonospora phytophila]MCM0675147.1 MFS transporter [Micromonospora phytophila]
MNAASAKIRRLFALGVLLGLVAEQVVLFSVPLLIFQDTASVSTLGFAFALEWLPSLIAYPFAGLLADRDGGARLFSLATGGRALVLAGATAICLTQPDWTTPTLMASGALLSLMMAPVRMAIEKVVPRIAVGDDLPRTQALVQNMELLAMALGPALAVAAATVLGKTWLLGIASTVFAVAALCWLAVPRGGGSLGRGSVRGNLADIGLGWRLLIGNRPVILLAMLNFAINLVFATALSANAALVTGVFDAPESSFALLNTCVGLTGLVNLLIVPRLLRRFEIRAIGVFGFVLLGLALLVLGLAPSLLVYGPAFVLAFAGVAFFNVYNRTQRVRVIAREHLGKVMGPFYLLNLLSYPIAGLLMGAAGDALGPQRMVAGLAIGLAVLGSFLLPLVIVSFQRALAESEPVSVGAVT